MNETSIRTPLRVAILLLAQTMTAGAASAQTDDTIDESRLFAEASHILGGARNPAMRWSDRVDFAVIGTDDAFVRAMASAVFDQISILTGIETTRVEHASPAIDGYLAAVGRARGFDSAICDPGASGRCANFVVLVTDRRTMGKAAEALHLRPVHRRAIDAAEPLHCFFAPSITSAPHISRAVVFVNEALSLPMINTCLHEEIYQSFGLFGDYGGSRYFSFNDLVAPKHVTRFDRALLATLYRERARSVSEIATRLVKALERRIPPVPREARHGR